jgi:hypothetical protein
MRWCCVVALIGCGRLGYDSRIDAGSLDDAPVDIAIDAPPTCPLDTVPLSPGSQVCIEIVERGTIPWTDAVLACSAVGRRLCADAEWFEGCVNATGLVDMLDGEFEWVAEEVAGVAQKRGVSDCTTTATHAVVDPYEFRCCVDL